MVLQLWRTGSGKAPDGVKDDRMCLFVWKYESRMLYLERYIQAIDGRENESERSRDGLSMVFHNSRSFYQEIKWISGQANHSTRGLWQMSGKRLRLMKPPGRWPVLSSRKPCPPQPPPT